MRMSLLKERKLNALPYIHRNHELVSTLDLSHTLIVSAEAKELGKALANDLCRVLVKLDLRSSCIEDEGAVAIFQGLAKNNSILDLNLQRSLWAILGSSLSASRYHKTLPSPG